VGDAGARSTCRRSKHPSGHPSGMTGLRHYVETGTSAGFDKRWARVPRRARLKGAQYPAGFPPRFVVGTAILPLETITMGKSALTWPSRRRTALKRLVTTSRPTAGGAIGTCRRAIEWPRCSLPRRCMTKISPCTLHVADTALCATRCITISQFPVRNLLSRECLRNDCGRVKGGQKFADQFPSKLRALQDATSKEPYPGQITWVTTGRWLRPQLSESLE